MQASTLEVGALTVWQPPLFEFGPPPPMNRRLAAAARRLVRLRGQSDLVVHEIARQLQEHSFAILDDFMGDGHAEQPEAVRREAHIALTDADARGRIGGGQAVSALRSDRSIWERVGSSSRDRGDQRRALDEVADRVDGLIVALREARHSLAPAFGSYDSGASAAAHTVQELTTVRWRSDAMLARYPRNGSHYVRHLDNVCAFGRGARCNGRRLTVVYYLNPAGTVDHGALRIFRPGAPHSEPLVDIEPLIDRAVVFWSDERTPHAVLPTGPAHDRYALTFWYFCEAELNATLASQGQAAARPVLRAL